MSTQTPVAFEKMIFRKTNAQAGRHLSVTPQNSTMRHLAYGRIILNSSKPSVSFSAGDRETALICLSGQAAVKTDGRKFKLGRYDAIYYSTRCNDRCIRKQRDRPCRVFLRCRRQVPSASCTLCEDRSGSRSEIHHRRAGLVASIKYANREECRSGPLGCRVHAFRSR
jgi:5-deoxy-D-glucuronate isomerase